MDGDLLILESAHRHGIDEDDMMHAVEFAQWLFPQEGGVVMHIGPARPGHPMLEIGIVRWHGVLAVVHAMTARPQYLRGEMR